jgi:hypothetical protein
MTIASATLFKGVAILLFLRYFALFFRGIVQEADEDHL